jgi:hypothetical protein
MVVSPQTSPPDRAGAVLRLAHLLEAMIVDSRGIDLAESPLGEMGFRWASAQSSLALV